MTKKPTPHPIGFVVNTHPLTGGSNATLNPKRKRKAHAKPPRKSWRVRCEGCGTRSEWQTSELAAQSWSASHRCPK